MKKKILTTLFATLIICGICLTFGGCWRNENNSNNLPDDYTKEDNAEFELVGNPIFIVEDFSYGGYWITFSPTVRCLTPNFRYKYVVITTAFFNASNNVIYKTDMNPSYQSSSGTFGEQTIEFQLFEKPTYYKIKDIKGFNE